MGETTRRLVGVIAVIALVVLAVAVYVWNENRDHGTGANDAYIECLAGPHPEGC